MTREAVARLIEPVPVEDDYCSGLGVVEDVDGANARFVLYVSQTCYEADNAEVLVVRRKIILPYRAIGPGVDMATAFLARRAVRITGQRLLRLVKR